MFRTDFALITLADLIGYLIAIAGIWFVVRQLYETKLATQMEGMLILGQMDVENAKNWQLLISLSDSEGWKNLSPEEAHDKVFSNRASAEAFDAAYTWFELLGSLVQNRALEISMVKTMWGEVTISWWERLGQIVLHRRLTFSHKSLGSNWEWLAKEFENNSG